MDSIDLQISIPIIGEYDVIVAGGGVAGVAAAVSAGRMGKKVLLIEKTTCLGGLATIGLVNLFVPMCNGRGKQIIKGMAEELLKLSVKYGYDTIPDEWKNGEPGEDAKSRYLTRFSVPVFILALTEFVKNEGVDIMFDTLISRPVMNENICKGIIVENKSGSAFYSAKMVIDTTGDGDVLYRAGVPTVQGKDYHTFYMYGANLESCKKVVEGKDFSKLPVSYFGGASNLYGKNHPEGKPYWNGTDANDVTNYIVENHIEALNNIKNEDRKTRDLLQIPTMPQFRTTRHIDGDYTLTTDDVYKHFEDSVGAICDFDQRDYLYEIPYRTLIRTGFNNLITAGRCASGEGYAWDVIRVIPPAILTGQVAGVASSLAIDMNTKIYNVNIKKLQEVLKSQDIMIHFDDSLMSTIKKEDKNDDIGHI